MNTLSHDPMLTQLEDDIRSGKIKMKSRLYFLARYAVVIFGTILILLFGVYLGSFVLFLMRTNGIFILPSLGWPGLFVFLRDIPWLLVAVVAIFVLSIEYVTRHTALVYRRPLLYSAAASLAVVALGSVVVANTSLHDRLSSRLSAHRIPLVTPLYGNDNPWHPKDIHMLLLIKRSEPLWLTQTVRGGEERRIRIMPGTRFPLGDDIHEGDTIFVLGERKADLIQAQAIRKIRPTMAPRPPVFHIQPFDPVNRP